MKKVCMLVNLLIISRQKIWTQRFVKFEELVILYWLFTEFLSKIVKILQNLRYFCVKVTNKAEHLVQIHCLDIMGDWCKFRISEKFIVIFSLRHRTKIVNFIMWNIMNGNFFKKFLSPKEFFKINLTFFFWPWPPYHLKFTKIPNFDLSQLLKLLSSKIDTESKTSVNFVKKFNGLSRRESEVVSVTKFQTLFLLLNWRRIYSFSVGLSMNAGCTTPLLARSKFILLLMIWIWNSTGSNISLSHLARINSWDHAVCRTL